MNFSKLSGWMRLGIVVSAVWIVSVYATSDLEEFVLVGTLPLIVIWGMFWVVKGFKSIKRKSADAKLIPKEQKILNDELANKGKKESSAKIKVKVSSKVKTLFLIS